MRTLTRYASTTVVLMLLSLGLLGKPTLAQVAPTNSATINGSVIDTSGNPVRDAQVTISGPKNDVTHTDAQGLFSFIGVPFGTYRISVTAGSLGTITRSVSIQDDVNVAIQFAPANLKTIARVSTTNGSIFNVTPASVTQVSPMANAFQGITEWRTVLEQIPGIAQAGLSVGNYWQASLPDGPLMPMQISIDGALPYETAVLLDNMPLRSTSIDAPDPGTGTNIGMYPLNSFGAADVVRGPGASSPSIVDSIGGSFVLHAPSAVTQNHFELSVSNDAYGGIVENTLGQFRLGKLSAQLAWGFNDSPGPISQYGVAGYFFDVSTINGQPFIPYSTCAAPTCFFGMYRTNPALPGGGPFSSFYGLQSGFFYCCIHQTTAWSQHNDSASLRYDFSPRVSAQIFYANGSSYMSNPAGYYYDDFTPPPGYSGSLAAGNQFLPVLGDTVSLFPIYQALNLLEEKVNIQIGNGVLQVAALQNRSYVEGAYSTGSSFSAAHLWGGGTLGGVPTIFNGGPATIGFSPPVAFDEGNQSNSRDMMASYNTPLGPSTRAGFSIVQSYYNAPFLCNVLEPPFPPYAGRMLPSENNTTNEVRFFVGDDPSSTTSIDLSWYITNADYHVTNPKVGPDSWVDENYGYSAPRLGFVWRPSAEIAVRASAGGGFAEAPLTDLAGEYGSGNSNSPITCTPSGCSETITNINLQPERSFAWDVGADFRVRHDTIFALDIYRSNLFGQIYEESSSNSLYNGLPLTITQFGNIGESRYEGILAEAHHFVPHGIFWDITGGLTRGYVISVPGGFYNIPGTCTMCTNLNVVTGVNFNGTFAGAIPYAQAHGDFGYRWNPETSVDIVGTYFGNNNTYFRPAFTAWDAGISYPLGKSVSLLLTGRNLFGVYDKAIQYDSPASQIGVPAVVGGPYAEFGEMYGPRTVILTVNYHI